MAPPTLLDRIARSRVTPLVRASRNQIEIDLLPPYGDPEVSLPGEFATYVVLGGLLVEFAEQAREELSG